MGGRTNSSQHSETHQTSTVKTVNASAQDVESSNIVSNSGDNVTVSVTDHGAIAAAKDIASESLLFGGEAIEAIENTVSAGYQALAEVKNSQITGGQSIVATSAVEVFKPLAYGVAGLIGLALMVMLFKGARNV